MPEQIPGQTPGQNLGPDTPAAPTWYDVLGLDRGATGEEIAAAWRAATERIDPQADRARFRSCNQAADVLLDPRRRASYDASLPDEDQPAEDQTLDQAPEPESTPESNPEPAGALAEQPQQHPAGSAEAFPGAAEPTREVASRGLVAATVVLALLAVAALTCAAIFAVKVRQDNAVSSARDDAPAAAERAAASVFSYDYRTLPADRKRASKLLTDSYRKKYLETFATLERSKDGQPGVAVASKTTVKATVLGSGVIDVDAEADVARVLVYANQVSTRPGAQPQVFQNRVAMTMVRAGDRWLVDGVDSY